MRSRLQTRLWTKEELAARASAWARTRGWTGVTVASLLKWKQEGLMPRPTVRSLGRGRGSISGWNWPQYRRLLDALTYRQRLRRWRDIRIALWLDGYEIDLDQIRSDLDGLFTDLVLLVNRELRTERWQAVEGKPPTTKAQRAIARHFTGLEALEGLISRLELDPAAESLIRLALSALMTTEGQRLAIAFVHQFFSTGHGDIPSAVAAVRRTVPQTFADALDGAETTFTAHAGLLAHPVDFENPLLDAIRVATATTLLNLREMAKESNRSWTATMHLAAAVLEVRGDALGSFRLMAPLLARLASMMAARPPFRSMEARAVILALALSSESVRADEGIQLTRSLRALARFSEWLVIHRELLCDIETLTSLEWANIMNAPDFPVEARLLLPE